MNKGLNTKEFQTVTAIMPEGERIRRAIKWIAAEIEENPGQSYHKLAREALARFDLSPKEGEFLIEFYRKEKGENHSNA
jgi:hypothetical protein